MMFPIAHPEFSFRSEIVKRNYLRHVSLYYFFVCLCSGDQEMKRASNLEAACICIARWEGGTGGCRATIRIVVSSMSDNCDFRRK